MNDIKLSHELQESFTVNMPIFKGLPNFSFKIDILCEVTSGDVVVWLESKELMELQKSQLSTVIDEELKAFQDIVCIEQ